MIKILKIALLLVLAMPSYARDFNNANDYQFDSILEAKKLILLSGVNVIETINAQKSAAELKMIFLKSDAIATASFKDGQWQQTKIEFGLKSILIDFKSVLYWVETSYGKASSIKKINNITKDALGSVHYWNLDSLEIQVDEDQGNAVVVIKGREIYDE
jgi:hypothetical protein